ncbi:MAG: hypothetical protein ACRDWE_00630 [Acidimicrobiales bacterium]
MSFTGTGTGSTVWQRLQQTFLRPPAPRPAQEVPDVSALTDDEKRSLIVRVDPTDRKLGIIASIVGVVLALYANLPGMIAKTSVPITTIKPKGTTCKPVAGVTALHYVTSAKACYGVYAGSHYALPLAVSLVLALAIYVTVLIGRRSPLAFVMVMTGLAFGTLLVLVPFGAGGAWVMVRAWRTQKRGSPTAKAPLPGWTAPPPRGTTRRSTSTGPRGSRRRRGEEQKTNGRKTPSANKRYTPKSPPKKKAGKTV